MIARVAERCEIRPTEISPFPALGSGNDDVSFWWSSDRFGGHLILQDYNAQVGEAMDMIRALNKMTRANMPESVRII